MRCEWADRDVLVTKIWRRDLEVRLRVYGAPATLPNWFVLSCVRRNRLRTLQTVATIADSINHEFGAYEHRA